MVSVWQHGNIRVARISGIAIEIHVTFAFVILWGGWQGAVQYRQHGEFLGALYGILLISLLFGCILLHELGHGLQARAFGLVVRRITILPVGGIAQLETPPAHPWQELVIALAGPMVNLALAIVLGIIAYLIEPLALLGWAEWMNPRYWRIIGIPEMLVILAAANLLLFVFNMLPAFPMDGGRVLRAALALAFDYELATRISAWLGRILALIMSVFGVMGWPPAGLPANPMLLLIGFMVFFGARQEEIYVRRQRALVRVEVHEVTQRGTEMLAPWDTVTGGLVARLFRHEMALPVVVEGRVVGLLTYHDVRRAHRRAHESPLTVAHVMRTSFPVLKLSDTLWVAVQEMHTFQLATLPVVENGAYHGMVRLDDINHAWRFAAGRRRSPSTLVSGDTALYD